MPINPNIALGVQPLQLADPMAQYGKVIAIQGAQNQNALNQYQLSAAKRAEETQNMLARAYSESVDPATGKIDYNKLTGLVAAGGGGAQLPAIQKSRIEQETALTTQQKAQTELVDAKLKQARGFLETINPADPNAPAQYIAWHEANHKDPVLGPVLAARGVTADQSRTRIADAIQKGPAAFAELLNQSKLGTEKFMELNKPQLSTKDVGATLEDRTFEPLTGKITTVSTTPKTKTFADTVAERQANIAAGRLNIERDRLAQEATGVVYQEDANGNVIALPSKLKKGEVPVARVAVAPGGGFQPLTGKPSESVGKELLSLNQQKAVLNSAIKYLDKAPEAFGFKRGLQGELVGTTLDTPEQIEARSYVYNVVSNVIKERAGTAQTAGEKETLNRFLPSEYDNASEIKAKFTAFQQYLADKETGTTKKRGGGGGTPPKPAAGGSGVDTNNPLLK